MTVALVLGASIVVFGLLSISAAAVSVRMERGPESVGVRSSAGVQTVITTIAVGAGMLCGLSLACLLFYVAAAIVVPHLHLGGE